MKILNKYLLKEIVSNVLMVMLALIAMFSFFDLIQELDALGKGSYGLGKILLFVLLSAPGHVYDVMPVAVLVGCMYSLGQFARYSELVVLRVSGLSIFDIAVLLLKIGAIFTIITFLIGELVTPFSEKRLSACVSKPLTLLLLKSSGLVFGLKMVIALSTLKKCCQMRHCSISTSLTLIKMQSLSLRVMLKRGSLNMNLGDSRMLQILASAKTL
jgi:hypothetical protein